MREIDAETALFGLLGDPVGHSLSPFLQNTFMRQTDYNGVYLAFPLKKARVGEALRGLHALGVRGLNVTLPHKETVLPYLCGLSAAAQACGAANTLIWTPEGYYGDNTDGAGLLAALAEKYGWQASGARILLLGAGGAAKGVSAAMALAGAEEICIVNRSAEKAERLAEQIASLSGTRARALPLSALADGTLYESYDTVVNTTSVGMAPRADEMPPVDCSRLGARHLAVDLIYNPPETKFLRLARLSGARTASGLGMFLHQGALAFARWTGTEPETAGLEAQLEARLRRVANPDSARSEG